LPLRKLTSVLLLFVFPAALFAADKPETSSALVHAHGKVELNGAESPSTIALFAGDWVQTQPDSVANIVAEGSSVLVMPNAAVKYQGDGGGVGARRRGDLDHMRIGHPGR
jgi:hypothetical protein